MIVRPFQDEVWRRRVNRDSSSVFVAENEGALVGFASLLLTPEGCELDAIHVDPDAQRAGVGSALMHAAVEHARSHDVGGAQARVVRYDLTLE